MRRRTEPVTGVVLAGGRGRRMGGVDKGLQPFLDGRPLVAHALERLRPQVDRLAINANRHLLRYAAWGVPVWPDPPEVIAGCGAYAGPLAGMLAALQACDTPLLLTVACDGPGFPLDLARRLHAALAAWPARRVAVAAAMDSGGGGFRREPAFCLIRQEAEQDLRSYLLQGGRRVEGWLDREAAVVVRFEAAVVGSGQIGAPFANANTQAELRRLEAATARSHRYSGPNQQTPC